MRTLLFGCLGVILHTFWNLPVCGAVSVQGDADAKSTVRPVSTAAHASAWPPGTALLELGTFIDATTTSHHHWCGSQILLFLSPWPGREVFDRSLPVLQQWDSSSGNDGAEHQQGCPGGVVVVVVGCG